MPPRGKYVKRFECLEQPGPPVLVAILARPFAVRWLAEMKRPQNRPGLAWLDQMLLSSGLPSTSEHLKRSRDVHQERSWSVVGFAVFNAWRLVQLCGQPAAQSRLNSVSAVAALHDLNYGSENIEARACLEFPVVDAVYLPEPVLIPTSDPLELETQALDTPAFSRDLWEWVAHGAVAAVHASQPAQPHPLRDFVSTWTVQHQFHSAEAPRIVGWRMWTPMGALMARRKLPCDLVPVTARAAGRFAVRLLTNGPPQHLLQQYLQLQVVGPRLAFRGYVW